MSTHLVIAIDGPSGAGKSTAAKALAKSLGIHILDTGALFRAYALHAIDAGLDPSDTAAVNDLLRDVRLDIVMTEDGQRTLVNDVDVSDRIRAPRVAQGASTLGANPFVRKVLTDQVRRIANSNSIVVDGRDIGTSMLPDATVKFFLTATPEQRARRRTQEQKAMGIEQDFNVVLAEIIARDEADSNRPIAPLCRAADAVVIDSTDMDATAVFELMLKTIEERTR
jgi:cytidylate kinase